MNCPICKGILNDFDDNLFVCEGECAAEFGLEYLGTYEDNLNERVDDGFESDEWKKLFGKTKEKFKLE